MFYIYIHTNILNNNVYIGITKQSLNQRWRKGEGYRDSKKFYFAIKKYGWDSFRHQVIQTTNTLEKAQILEKMWVSFYKKRTNIYNITDGGEGSNGHKMSEETKQKISNALKGKIPYNKGLVGRKWSEESKEKASLSHKGRKPWNTGKSGYHIKSLGKGRPNLKGVPKSPEHIMKVRISQSIPVSQFDLEGNLIKNWMGISFAAEELNIDRTGIWQSAKGKIKTYKGFVWKYCEA